MPCLVVTELVEGTREQYDAVAELVHPEGALPPGQTQHYAGRTSTGWVVASVWDSKPRWRSFRGHTLVPAMKKIGLPGPTPSKEVEMEIIK